MSFAPKVCSCGKFVPGERYVPGRDCPRCWTYHRVTNSLTEFRDPPGAAKTAVRVEPECLHRGDSAPPPEGRDVRRKYVSCGAGLGVVAVCDCNARACDRYRPPDDEEEEPVPGPAAEVTREWAYGVTTVPERRATTLPGTLRSLASSGFPTPRLFVDGDWNSQSWMVEFPDHPVTCRYPRANVHGNWFLALHELFIRSPHADRYAVFQDDLVCSANLRRYLDSFEYPKDGYWNLYTVPHLQALAPRTPAGGTVDGWYQPVDGRRGMGALALVFDNEAALQLMCSRDMVERPKNALRGWRFVDGGVVNTLEKFGRRETVHSPSLVQHTGTVSAMDKSGMSDGSNPDFPKHVWAPGSYGFAESFRGEGFDLMSLRT